MGVSRWAVPGRGPDDDAIVLPLLPWRHRWALLLQRTRTVTALLVLGGLLVALLTGGGLTGGGGLANRVVLALVAGAALVHVFAWVAQRWTVVEVRPDVSGEWVRLAPVHPAFAESTAAALTQPPSPPVLAGGPGDGSVAQG